MQAISFITGVPDNGWLNTISSGAFNPIVVGPDHSSSSHLYVYTA